VLSVRALAWLGRRLVTLDLGVVAVRVPGGTKTLAACCPMLERLSAQLCQQQDRHLDAVDPTDLAKGCAHLIDLDLAPVDWDDTLLRNLGDCAGLLRGLALKQVASHATRDFLAPILSNTRLISLHLALHARTDLDRAMAWLEGVAQLRQLRSLSLDYAAPLRLSAIVQSAFGGGEPCELRSFTVHGCHGVDDAAICAVATACPKLEQFRVFPDSWRELGEVGDAALRVLQTLPRLRALALGSRAPLLVAEVASEDPPPRWRSLSLFAPLGNGACAAAGRMACLRHLWLGPHKLMQHGVGAGSSISDDGLACIAGGCPGLLDLTIASLCVTDVGSCMLLRSCRELRRLRLGGHGITEVTLEFLMAVSQPRLERLSLWFSGVSAEGAKRAEEAMPWTHFDVEASDPL